MTGLKRIISIVISIILVAWLVGCSGGADAPGVDDGGSFTGIVKPEQVTHATATVAPPSSYDLRSQSGIKVGNCTIHNDEDYLYFHYETSEFHPMTAVRIFAGDTPPSGDEEYYPKNATYDVGDLAVVPVEPLSVALLDEPMDGLRLLPPGVLPLPYYLTGLDEVSSLDLMFILPDNAASARLYVQADASISNGFGGEYTAEVEDPAAPGVDVIEYSMLPVMNLPEESVNVTLRHGIYTDSTYVTTLQDCPLGLDVKPNLPYLGWCVDLGNPISTGYTYNSTLFSSYATDLPVKLMDDDWDMVNYILNHKQGYHSDVQSAIWYFIGGGAYPTGIKAKAMVEDALENGEGFVPEPSEVVAVIVEIATDTQTTVIEVTRTDDE